MVLCLMEKKPLTAAEASGWLGMFLLQGATLPSMLGRLLDPASAHLPPLSMVLMVWTGLALYFWRAYAQKDVLYMVSNGTGIFLNTILMAIILFPKG